MSDRPADLLAQTVLVAGAGRSGTTWLGKLLDASRFVHYRHEPDNRTRTPWFRDIPSRLDPVPENDAIREPFARALESAFWAHGVHFLRPPEFPKAFLRPAPWQMVNLLFRAQRKLGLGRDVLLTMPRWAYRGDLSRVRYVVKSVTSNLRLAWIHRHFPEIRILLIVRHPGGYLSSWLRGTRDHGWSGFGDRARLDPTLLPFPLAEQRRYDEVYSQGTPFERELVYWIIANETPVLALKGSASVKVVVYEELCRRPAAVVRELYEFCGIPIEDSTLRFIDESTSQHSEDFHAVYKDPKRVADAWHEELDPEQIQTVETFLGGTSLADCWRET